MKGRLRQLREALGDARSILILPHNDPDPDAIASALGLRELLGQALGVEAEIVYKGIIGRAENRELVRYLGNPMKRLTAQMLSDGRPFALVDTQPGAGNNSLPAGITPVIVIDHHSPRQESEAVPFADVRPEIGAASTLVTRYLRGARIDPRPELATALFYGIKTDTMGLGRGATREDIAAYFYLQPRIDVEALVEIERAQVPADYFKNFNVTLDSAQLYENVVVTYCGTVRYPDLVAEMADLLLRLQGARWVICSGTYKDSLIVAIRTRNRRGGAGHLVRSVVGDDGTAGGHGQLAGGHIPLNGRDPLELERVLRQRVLEYLKIEPDVEGKPLV